MALTISGITSNGPDQVWLYELRSRKLIPITVRSQGAIWVRDFVWSGDNTLYVKADPIYLAATMAAVRELDQPPAEIAELFERRARRDDSMESNSFGWNVQRVGRYRVTAEHWNHGRFYLTVRLNNDTKSERIATGSWELETFLLDSKRLRVLDPESFWYGAVVSFDLRTRQSRSLFFQMGDGLQLLDERHDGTLLAYKLSGDCRQDDVRYRWIIDVSFREHWRTDRHVCFIKPN